MIDSVTKSVLFPVFGTFPTVLTIGSSNQPKKDTTDMKVLFILDATGSMGEFPNELGECSKMILAKDLLQDVIKLGSYPYDIMTFNTKPHSLCNIDHITSPSGSTHFTPLVPELAYYFRSAFKYRSVVFLSDGQPTEPYDIAMTAIKQIGNITREAGANPVSVAIGNDADGAACDLFAGNRGYNCFIKYRKDIPQIAVDILNGIKCNYEMLPNGTYIPVEADNKYYYVGKEIVGESVKPDRQLVEKYLNLVIKQYDSDVSQYKLLMSLVEHSVKLLDNEADQKQLVEKYTTMLTAMKRVIIDNDRTPGLISAVAQCYRQSSGGQV